LIRRELRDGQWRRIEPLIPGKDGDKGRPGENNRLFIDAVLWLVRAGAPWRGLPDEFGKWNRVFRRFRRWAKKGVWKRLFAELGENPDLEYLIIDSTIVAGASTCGGRQKRESEDEAIGRSRGGLSTKINISVDALGNPSASS
jgi:transposase